MPGDRYMADEPATYQSRRHQSPRHPAGISPPRMPYKESNPLYVHLKELQRSIGMQREHLGLSAKAAKKMDSPRGKPDQATTTLDDYIEGIKG